jgi:hypothetical protein
MWRRYRDISFTAHGYAKALQHGAEANDIADELCSCTLCGACDCVCPEQIDITGMVVELRGQLSQSEVADLQKQMAKKAANTSPDRLAAASMLLVTPAIRQNSATLLRITGLLEKPGSLVVADDDGTDIALALEAGVAIPPQRLERFIKPMRALTNGIIADGLLLKHLRCWLPEVKFISLGEALNSLAEIRRNLRSTDLYIIEPRAYHADYQRLVKHYDRLRTEKGSAFSLDLQRIAIPATSQSLPQRLGHIALDDEEQANWLIKGHQITRIVVENLEDKAILQQVATVPVVHLAELAD